MGMLELAAIKTFSMAYLLGLVALGLATLLWRVIRRYIAPASRADAGFTLIAGTALITALLAAIIWRGVVGGQIYMSTHYFHWLMSGFWAQLITAMGVTVAGSSLLISFAAWLRGRTPVSLSGEIRTQSGLKLARRTDIGTAALIGCWRPQVWVNPQWWEQLSPAEQEMALCHERVHLQRRDNLRKLVLQCIGALYALLPYSRGWWKQYESDCELAVDDRCRRELDALSYAALIADGAGFNLNARIVASGMSQTDLRERLSLLSVPSREGRPLANVLAVAGVLAATLPLGLLLSHATTRCLLACYLGY